MDGVIEIAVRMPVEWQNRRERRADQQQQQTHCTFTVYARQNAKKLPPSQSKRARESEFATRLQSTCYEISALKAEEAVVGMSFWLFLRLFHLMAMSVIIRPTTPQDAHELARIWLASLEGNPMVRLASPEGITAKRLEGATRKTLEDLDDPVALCLTACDAETGTAMGCAVWRYYPDGKGLPSEYPKERTSSVSNTQDTFVKQSSLSVQPSISEDLDTASNAIFQRRVGNRPHAGKYP